MSKKNKSLNPYRIFLKNHRKKEKCHARFYLLIRHNIDGLNVNISNIRGLMKKISLIAVVFMLTSCSDLTKMFHEVEQMETTQAVSVEVDRSALTSEDADVNVQVKITQKDLDDTTHQDKKPVVVQEASPSPSP